MSRVITFSTKFPAYHPRKGEPTLFVEKIWRSYCESIGSCFDLCSYQASYDDCPNNQHEIGSIMDVQPKHHTIRAGNRWKAGDKFSPRVWGSDINPKSGKSGAYHSKQIVIAPDMEVKKVWRFHIASHNGGIYVAIDANMMDIAHTNTVAENDGLNLKDFIDWFRINTSNVNSKFTGQIICWNGSVDYNPYL